MHVVANAWGPRLGLSVASVLEGQVVEAVRCWTQPVLDNRDKAPSRLAIVRGALSGAKVGGSATPHQRTGRTVMPVQASSSHLSPAIARVRVSLGHQVALRVTERSAPRWAEESLIVDWADESVGKPDSVAHRERRGAIIHLRPLLPAAWCDLPGGSGEQPSGASADARTRPLDLAPGGVCRATPVTWGAGGLLHHRFTLTSEEAVCSLWHFPAGHPGWALPTTVLCGVRTFLDPPRKAGRDRLTDSSEIQANACPSIDETRRDLGRHGLDADRRI